MYVLNKEDEKTPLFALVAEYTFELIFESKSDFYFLKTWKKKIINDKYYKEAKLMAFLQSTGDKKEVYRMFVETLE